MVDFRVENQDSVSMSPIRLRLRIGLWALALMLLGFTLGLKADELPTFNAETITATSPSDDQLESSLRQAASNSFIQTVEELGEGNIYTGIQKMAGVEQLSFNFSPSSNGLISIFADKAFAQVPPCSDFPQYEELFNQYFSKLLEDKYKKDMKNYPCTEKMVISGEVGYSVLRKGRTYYARLQFKNVKWKTTVWQRQPDGRCIPVEQTGRPAKEEVINIQINPDRTYTIIGIIPDGAEVLCSQYWVKFGPQTIKNPGFDKEKCCGKKKTETPAGTEQ